MSTEIGRLTQLVNAGQIATEIVAPSSALLEHSTNAQIMQLQDELIDARNEIEKTSESLLACKVAEQSALEKVREFEESIAQLKVKLQKYSCITYV